MFKRVGMLFSGACVAVTGFATSAMAVLSPTDLTAIQTGISDADVNYYAIGGSILVVLAGIWGFKKVIGLLR